MQTINMFYYPNVVDVQWNNDSTLTLRNRVMFQRTVKLYKGVDNVIRFNVKNQDQQLVNITGWEIMFNMISNNDGQLIIRKPVTVIDANAGVVTATVSELDLINLTGEYYSYSLSIIDQFGSEQVVYADDNYGVRGEIKVESGHYPSFRPSIKVQFPTVSNSNIITSTITNDTISRQRSSQHSAQFYFNEFTGSITVQGTLDILPPNGNLSANTSLSWATISNIGYVDQTVTDYHNWDGVYSAVRFIVTKANASPLSGNVSAILYRA